MHKTTQKFMDGFHLNVSKIDVVYETKVPYSKMATCRSSKDIEAFFRSQYDTGKMEYIESSFMLIMSSALKVIAVKKIADGSVGQCVMDGANIAQAALLVNGRSVAICHNHPSGNLYASESDRKVTKNVKSILALLNMQLVDHIILTKEGFYSFADNGEL